MHRRRVFNCPVINIIFTVPVVAYTMYLCTKVYSIGSLAVAIRLKAKYRCNVSSMFQSYTLQRKIPFHKLYTFQRYVTIIFRH
jgi:hypothetical protein